MANDGWTITPGSLQQRFDATGGTDPVARGETLFNTKAISINGVRGLNPDGPVATFQTTDPGRALITGKWADRGRFKGPILRGSPRARPAFTTAARPLSIRCSTSTPRASA